MNNSNKNNSKTKTKMVYKKTVLVVLCFVVWLGLLVNVLIERDEYTHTQCTIIGIRENYDVFQWDVNYVKENGLHENGTITIRNSPNDLLLRIGKEYDCYYFDDDDENNNKNNENKIVFELPTYYPYVVFVGIFGCFFVLIICYTMRPLSYYTSQRDRINSKNKSDIPSCVVCLDRVQSTRLHNCNHNVMCYKCASDCKKRDIGCPICRTPISRIEIGVYSDNDYVGVDSLI